MSIGALVMTMFDIDADPVDRANAAQQVITHLYGGGHVPSVWLADREALLEVAREIRRMRPTLDENVPSGMINDDEPPTDKEPTDD